MGIEGDFIISPFLKGGKGGFYVRLKFPRKTFPKISPTPLFAKEGNTVSPFEKMLLLF